MVWPVGRLLYADKIPELVSRVDKRNIHDSCFVRHMAQIVPPHMVITFQDVLKAFYWVLILLLSAYGSYAAMRRRDSRKG